MIRKSGFALAILAAIPTSMFSQVRRRGLRILILFAVLAITQAPMALAQDEDVVPNGEDNPSTWNRDNAGTACSSTTCEDEVDEDPDGTLDGLEVNTATDAASIRWDFATPSTCTTPGGTQTFNFRLSKCNDSGVEASGGADPTYDAALYCGGVSQATLATGVSVTGLDQDVRLDWTWDADCASDGSDVQLQIISNQNGGGPNRRHVCVEAGEWECNLAAAAGPQLITIN